MKTRTASTLHSFSTRLVSSRSFQRGRSLRTPQYQLPVRGRRAIRTRAYRVPRRLLSKAIRTLATSTDDPDPDRDPGRFDDPDPDPDRGRDPDLTRIPPPPTPGHPMPRTDTAAALAIATTDTNVPIDLEGIIVSAAAGDALARDILRPVVLRIALEELTYADAAERVTELVLVLLDDPHDGPGKPLSGRAVAWIDNVTRTYARYEREDRARKQWEQWDGPEVPYD